MKKITFKVLAIGAMASLGFASTSTAALVGPLDVGGTAGIVFDDVANQYWFQDLNAYANLAYDPGQINAVGTIETNFSSATNPWGAWHLADQSEINGLFLNSQADIVDKFLASDGGNAYVGRTGVYDSNTSTVGFTNWVAGGAWQDPSTTFITGPLGAEAWSGAWYTADADAAPVPIPGAVLLLGSGLLGLAGVRRKKNK